MSDPTPIKITPIAPSKHSDKGLKTGRGKRIPWPLILIPALLIVAYLIFETVPTFISDSVKTASDTVVDEQALPPIEEEDLPFRDIELERSQEKAQVTLREFGALQDRVESEELGLALYQKQYDAIIEQANQADQVFAQREFENALAEYGEALVQLAAYVRANDEEFDAEYVAGVQSLNARKYNESKRHIERAAKIKPKDMAVDHALTRLTNLPRVNELIRQSQRAQLRGNFDEAQNLLKEVREIDPEINDLEDQLQQIDTEVSQNSFNSILTRALTALDRKDLSTAKSEFERALAMRPNNTTAISGLQRVEQEETLAQVNRLRTQAQELEAADNYKEALRLYSEALEINSSLQFAIDGKERAAGISSLYTTIQRVLNDPAILSSTKSFDNANQTLMLAQDYRGISPKLDQAVVGFKEILQLASEPLKVVILSDNTLEIRLSTVGDLGLFDRKEVNLRPGRYLLTGSGNGCKDVRRTIIVSKGMSPVAIRCNEPI